MKVLSGVILVFFTISCAQVQNPPLIEKKNCINTCTLRDKEYKGYDEDLGCFCADEVIED
jgi:hypothetical protein